MKLKLNIGLETIEGKPLSFERVSARLIQIGFQRISARIEQSATEPTLVWSGTFPEYWKPEHVLNALKSLAGGLQQDCIAVQLSAPSLELSALVGPDAAKWGPFNPDHFIK